MKKKQTTQDLIIELAKELGYETKVLDKNRAGPVVEICKNNKCCLIDGGACGYYPTNLRWQSALFKDKITLQKYLKKSKIRTISSTFFRIFDFTSNEALLKAVQTKIKLNAYILKPATGHDGSDIKIIQSEEALRKAVSYFYKNGSDFMIQKILHQDEIRLFIQRGEIIVLHSKNHKYIRSNGEQSISEQLNRIPQHKQSPEFIKSFLLQNKLTLKSVPEKGTKIFYHLVKDNTREYIQIKNFAPELKKWAKNLSDALQANVIGVDIFVNGDVQDPSNYTVIEVNANPSFRDYAQTYKNRDISKKILRNELKFALCR